MRAVARMTGWLFAALLLLPFFYGLLLGVLFEYKREWLPPVMAWAAPLEAWAAVHIPAVESVRADLHNLGAMDVAPLAVHVYSLLLPHFIACSALILLGVLLVLLFPESTADSGFGKAIKQYKSAIPSVKYGFLVFAGCFLMFGYGTMEDIFMEGYLYDDSSRRDYSFFHNTAYAGASLFAWNVFLILMINFSAYALIYLTFKKLTGTPARRVD